jgi:hypothetical protein
MEFDAYVGLFGETAKLTHEKLDNINHGISKLNRSLPIRKPIYGSAISTGASTPLLVESLQMAPIGRVWNILSLGIFGSDGHTPVPFNPIVLAASGTAAYNNNPTGVQLTIAGGTVSAIAINGTTTGLTSGTFSVPASGTVTVTYTVAPTTFTTQANSVSTPSGATADIYVASSGIENPDFSAQIDSGTDIPSIQFYPRLSQWCKFGERIVAFIYGVPANQQIVLIGRVAEHRLEDVETLGI